MEILNLVSYNGDIDLIRQRIASADADELNAVSKRKGNTPLHIAAIEGRAEIIALLLHAGATIEPKNTDGNTPLQVAMLNKHKYCVQLLLLAQTRKLGGGTDMVEEALHDAVKEYRSSGKVNPLNWIGADVNARNSDGESPLLVAAHWGDPDLVQLLLNHGADANALDKNHESPLHKAVAGEGNADIVQLLLNHGADANTLDKNHVSPLHMAAARWGGADIVQLLLGHGADANALDKNHESPLHMAAARWGGADIVQLLLGHGADANALDKNHESPLHKAVAGEGNADIVQLLLNHGADVNATDKNHVSPLHMAAAGEGDPDLVQLLLNHGADANALDKNHESPLHMAAAGKGDPDIVQLLLNHGADANTLDKKHVSPLHMAAAGEGDPGIVQLLLGHGADVNATDKNHVSPLHMAAASPYANAIVQLLLGHGADANTLDKNHESPLLVALAEKNPNCTRMLLPLTSEAVINAHDGKGKTPLSIAASQGNNKTVILLLNAGADPNKTSCPETHGTLENPLKAAISNYYVKTATTLLQNGALLNGPAYDALAGFYKDFGADTTDYDKRRLLSKRRELLKMMLQLGMDPSQTISQQGSACGDTLLHVMCRHDAPIEDILKLLEYDRNALNKKNADGDTPLASHIGGEKLRVGVVRTLLDYGADATVTNDEELSLLSLLDKRPVVEVTNSLREVLIDNGADNLVQSQPPQPERSLSGGAPGAYRCFPM